MVEWRPPVNWKIGGWTPKNWIQLVTSLNEGVKIDPLRPDALNIKLKWPRNLYLFIVAYAILGKQAFIQKPGESQNEYRNGETLTFFTNVKLFLHIVLHYNNNLDLYSHLIYSNETQYLTYLTA